MKITCLQMDMKFGLPAQNFSHAEHLIDRAMQEKPDVLVLPETWNTGFFPKEHLARYSCQDGDMVKRCIGSLAEKYHVHIVAGSVSNVRGGNIYNTAMVFDRSGQCIAEYDKTHLFTPMGEHNFYTGGDHLCRFLLDGIPCAVIICYDVRFPNWSAHYACPESIYSLLCPSGPRSESPICKRSLLPGQSKIRFL